MEGLVKSSNGCWVRSGMPNILRINKLQISLGKVELFYLFVACSFTSREATVLLLVGYGLACPKVSEITDH